MYLKNIFFASMVILDLDPCFLAPRPWSPGSVVAFGCSRAHTLVPRGLTGHAALSQAPCQPLKGQQGAKQV